MTFYKLERTNEYDEDYQSNSSVPHKIHIVEAENEDEARRILSACCGAQYDKTIPTLKSDYGPFYNPKYFTCEIVEQSWVDQKYPTIPGNPPEVRYPRVDEHYHYRPPCKDK